MRGPAAAMLVVAVLTAGSAVGVVAGTAAAKKSPCGRAASTVAARACVLRARPWQRRRARHMTGLAGPAGAGGTLPTPVPGTVPVTTTAPSGSPGPPPTVPPATTTSTATSPPPAVHRTGVALTEFAVALAHPTLASGAVELNGINDGMDDHDLTIATAGGTLLAQTPVIAPGGQAQLNLDLAPGTYKVFCSLYGGAHDAAGMHATLTVR